MYNLKNTYTPPPLEILNHPGMVISFLNRHGLRCILYFFTQNM